MYIQHIHIDMCIYICIYVYIYIYIYIYTQIGLRERHVPVAGLPPGRADDACQPGDSYL